MCKPLGEFSLCLEFRDVRLLRDGIRFIQFLQVTLGLFRHVDIEAESSQVFNSFPVSRFGTSPCRLEANRWIGMTSGKRQQLSPPMRVQKRQGRRGAHGVTEMLLIRA